MVASNTYGRQVIVPLTNKSGGSVAAGDVVYLSDGSTADSFTTGTTANYTGGIGIAQETIASNATGRVLVSGYASLINVNASVTINHFGATYSVVKQATDAGSSRATGTFCQFLTGGTTPDAVVWQPDLGAGSGYTGLVSAAVATSQSTSSGTYTDLATVGPAVTVTVPASGKVLICISGENSVNGIMSVALSGANTVAAPADAYTLIYSTGGTNAMGRTTVLSGLTAGSTTFTCKYKAISGTPSFTQREIWVMPLP